MMKRKIIPLLFLFTAVHVFVYAQNDGYSPFALKLHFGKFTSLASETEDSETSEGGLDFGLATEFRLPKAPCIFISSNISVDAFSETVYRYVPPTYYWMEGEWRRETVVYTIGNFGAGLGIDLVLTQGINWQLFANGGVSLLNYTYPDESVSEREVDGFTTFGTGLYFFFGQLVSLGAELSNKNIWGYDYHWLNFAVRVAFHKRRTTKVREPKPDQEALPPTPKPLEKEDAGVTEKKCEITDVVFDEIFPVFFKYYDTHPIGQASIKNWSKDPVTDISLNLFIRQYMDAPKQCAVPSVLQPGEKATVLLNTLFTDKVLDITEGTKVACELTLNYSQKGEEYTSTKVETVTLYDRNAAIWDDNRKAAAFVTAKDPAVLKFSKHVAGTIIDKGSKAVNSNLRIALGMHEALSLYGMKYVVDPTTPYEELSRGGRNVDFLQFPKQTLEYRAGDCDDLSILYCALLESVGVETAFITIPGHIFIAFSADMKPEEGRKRFLRADELIFRDGKMWIPVEVTALEESFLKAWEKGAKQWREASSRGSEGFYPIHESWSVYAPVGIGGEREKIELPSERELTDVFSDELVQFIDREIYPQVAKLQTEISESVGSPEAINRLGVLYGRYGLMERAEKEFNRILTKRNTFVPALINIGNIYYLENDMEKALTYYETASRIDPDNPRVLLCVARAHHELENYGLVKKAYSRLKEIDSNLAVRFSYLDLKGEEAVRAAEMANVKDTVIWEE